MKARRIGITDTSLRDAHQSLWATRMRIGHIVPVLRKMDQIGFHSMEVWGGATFDACLRFLDEDPWERLRTIKHHCRKTPLQMLLRGQNLVGYRHYGDEIVREFVKLAADSGRRHLQGVRRSRTTPATSIPRSRPSRRAASTSRVRWCTPSARSTRSTTTSRWRRSWPTWERTASASKIWPPCYHPTSPNAW